MKDFKKGGFGGGSKGGFNKDRGGFGGERSFSKPTFGRPDFKKKSWDNKGPKSFGNDDRQMFDATCSSCGKPCQVPFRPSAGKQVFCNDCFGKMKGDETFVRNDAPRSFESRAPQGGGQNIDALVRQMQVVASKLDQLIVLVGSNAKQASKPAEAKPIEKTMPAPVAEVAKAAPAPKTAAPKKVAATKKAAPAKKVAAKKAPAKKK